MTEKNTNGTYKNNIQQYIEAYEVTLKNLGATNAHTRAILLSDVENLDWSYVLPTTTPLGNLAYWLGTASPSYRQVRYTQEWQKSVTQYYCNESSRGSSSFSRNY